MRRVATTDTAFSADGPPPLSRRYATIALSCCKIAALKCRATFRCRYAAGTKGASANV